MATKDDLLDFEQEARRNAQALEDDGRLPRGFVARNYPMSRGELRELRRLQACMDLATDADSFVALAHDRSVPPEHLERGLLNKIRRRR